MDKSANSYIDLDLGELAQVCDERAGELHARAWRSEAERNALREATAELLNAVARQLSSVSGLAPLAAPVFPAALNAADLHEVITHANHLPLQSGEHVAFAGGSRHAWIQDFTPGAEVNPGSGPVE